ncbi:hypothetical protein NDU88_003908 [Pleurodeles waltl]|uniref:Uncharacterized protein n=1 Tax=Pleurodeles waltl TaxID=8319 RepID=A0AAV7RHY2_PLEWA|nr:hypothetical protein NDU88_003908 [Pleurodeles waltl]
MDSYRCPCGVVKHHAAPPRERKHYVEHPALLFFYAEIRSVCSPLTSDPGATDEDKADQYSVEVLESAGLSLGEVLGQLPSGGKTELTRSDCPGLLAQEVNESVQNTSTPLA